MKIQGESGLVNVELDGADGEDLVAVRQARAEQTALARAGVTSASGFETNQAAEVADAGAATIANTAAATVSASQLVNGTASLDAALEATPKAQYVATAAEAGDLAAITSGKDGQVPLSRQQVVDTVLTAVSDPAQRAQVKALIDAGVTDDSLARAFTQVIDARQTPGDKKLSLDLVGFVTSEVPVQNGEYEYLQSVTNPASSPTHFDASMSVGADGSVNGKTLVADTLTAADLKPYPNGNSADHVKTQFDVVGDPGNLASLTAAHGDQPAISWQAVVDTVLAAPFDDRGASRGPHCQRGDRRLARAGVFASHRSAQDAG